MTQHMKLVVDDQGLRGNSSLEGRSAEWPPHIHDGQTDFAGFFVAKPGKEGVHTRLGAIGAAKPDGPPTDQIAHYDAIDVTLADGNLVDANGPGGRLTGPLKLFGHVL